MDLNESDHRKQKTLGFDPTVLFGNGLAVGCADLVIGGTLREVVGRVVAALLMKATDKNGGSFFSGATVLLPPVEATAVNEEDVFSALIKATHDVRGFAVENDEENILRRIVRVLHAPSLLVADLVRMIEAQGQRRLIAVAEASRFLDPEVHLPVAFGATALRLPEDRWSPHVTSLCQYVVSAAQSRGSYALVHVPELPPRKQSNKEMLIAVENCYVLELSIAESIEEAFAARSATWVNLAIQGRLDEVETELAGFDVTEGTKLHLLVQLVNRTGRREDTLRLLRQLQTHLEELPAEVAIQLAQFAAKAGDEELAHELLPSSPDGIGDHIWLEEGLEVATQLEDNDRIAKFDVRLDRLVPGSERLRENRDRRLLMNCQEANGDDHRFTTAGFSAHHLELHRRLSELEPDYKAAIEEAHLWGQEWFELAAVCCAMHARSTRRFQDAADMAGFITSSEIYGRQATQVLLYSIRAMMLREWLPKEEHDHYRELFQSAFQFLARNPADNSIRSSLTSLLSVESCGDLGVPLVALTMLDLAENGIELAPKRTESDEIKADLLNDGIKVSIANALRWMGQSGGVEPGVTVVPRELIVAPPDAVVATTVVMVQRASGDLGTDVDLDFMEKMVFVACAVSPHCERERDDDIRLMRLLASQLATAGQLQLARDYAEQILLMGQTSHLRQRLAWAAFADIYHRCRNQVVALVGIACALATEAVVSREDLWQEVYAIHRILRDLGLFELSSRFLPVMKKLLLDLGYDPDTDSRIVAADLSSRLMQASNESLDGMQELLAEIAAASKGALDDRSRLFPLAMLLGQAISKVEALGGFVTEVERDILEAALRKVGDRVAITIKTISAATPSGEDVLAMYNDVQRAATAADIARDYAVIGLAARRLLSANAPNAVPGAQAVFAVELLADQTVKLPSDAPVMTVTWAMEYAFSLNDGGYDVVFMALDDKGELSVMHVADRVIHVIDQPRYNETFRRRLDIWLEEFPRAYGTVDRDDGNNIFYLTMGRLDVRLPRSTRMLVVAEPLLQQLTTNLIVMNPEDGGWDYLAGAKSALGAFPSLSWLAAARVAQRSGKSLYKAWISAQLDSGLEGADEGYDVDVQETDSARTLDVALRRLSGSFEEFGFKVDTGRRLPRDMSDAGLVVVTAHGGLNSDGRYLHSIRDDESLVEAPSSLANSLSGVELVILFVCSGGRIDKNPWDNSTTSLPKQLLNGGSRAVIASPWPLNVLVTYNWLEPFLKAWEAGATVLEATKIANDAVARHFGDVPQYYLAMRPYGDLLLTRAG